MDNQIPSLFNVEVHLYSNHLGQNVPCSINQYGQCIYGYRYFCSECSFGLGGYASRCRNIDCKLYNKSMLMESLPDETKPTICTSIWDCTGKDGNCGYQNQYGQCKFQFKYWCCCGYGIDGMYSMCANTWCNRYISMNEKLKECKY